MVPLIFADSSAWYALSDERDADHDAASRFFQTSMRRETGRLATTDYVMDETLTLLRARRGLPAAHQLASLVDSSPNVELVWVGEERYRQALELMMSYRDKEWSFTDCTSFVVMRELGIRDAFTFDANFAQAGFQIHP